MRRRGAKSIYAKLAGLLGGLVIAFGSASTAQPDKPLDDDKTHVGMASCGGSTCHSNSAPVGRVVRQNEVVIWQDISSVSGAHSRAYSVLMSRQGKAIAANLGIGPAEKAPECLSCHAHNVSAEKRGPGFALSEGVTCEACHGGAEDWLSTHYTATASHADNIANGLYPTDDIEARASLCLDCHYGSTRDDQFVTHRIMGAGHPRMSFELDLFTALQQHHDVDEDYLTRKTDAGGFKTWAVGQAMATARSASMFANDRMAQDGLFPELYFFDCHACHKPIANDPKALASWRPNPGRPLGPGVPVYNDANNIMLKAALAELAPARGEEFVRLTRQLHASTRLGRIATKQSAQELAVYSETLKADFLRADFNRATVTAILNRILDDSLSGQYTNYSAGEQAVIAVDTFVNAMIQQGFADPSLRDQLRPSLDQAYDAVLKPSAYNPTALRAALRNIAEIVRTL